MKNILICGILFLSFVSIVASDSDCGDDKEVGEVVESGPVRIGTPRLSPVMTRRTQSFGNLKSVLLEGSCLQGRVDRIEETLASLVALHRSRDLWLRKFAGELDVVIRMLREQNARLVPEIRELSGRVDALEDGADASMSFIRFEIKQMRQAEVKRKRKAKKGARVAHVAPGRESPAAAVAALMSPVLVPRQDPAIGLDLETLALS